MKQIEKIYQKLSEIYKGERLTEAQQAFEKLVQRYYNKNFAHRKTLSEENVYLITYGDSFTDGDRVGLSVLKDVVDKTLSDTITDIHLLPMFPYTSDDGFSVTNYDQINPQLGDWSDIKKLSKKYRLMFDFVANHMSKSSEWFKKFLSDDPEFSEAFVEFEAGFDTSKVIRPRVSPLFHSYPNNKKVWTTFSEDQVDVNPKDVKMLVRLTKVLLDYAMKGATSVRLDAIGFLWKESGTTCMHLPQTHAIIQLWRMLLEEFAPNTQIITETNVPHEDNISYFGNGNDEAQQVYQFPLPPLVLHTFVTGNSEKLMNWASSIDRVSDTATYFNFLASHDGIGLRPTEGILSDDERQQLVDRILENGGRVSYKKNPDGSKSVYEMNINYSEALKTKGKEEFTAQKMIAAHHILLSIIGVPAIYYHSIFGSKNDYIGLEQSGINRRINREKLDMSTLFKELESDEYRRTIYHGIQKMITIRKKEAAFNPYGNQETINLGSGLFALKRHFKNQKIYSVTNVTSEKQDLGQLAGFDLISGKEKTSLQGYEVAWIKKE
ncbi:sugar phosphorylase [Streptococcus zalophi]|uniref:Sucrose phosphorylase n=1 Tax=Streptococcus zalophi TaxID=640031 RepID=A0A934UCU5_9STRE|nr:sugar phosphorylase [Streptococcus zalophi]MBJ8349127.1 sugar phosphorylase [Streptococcus zalophi]